MNYLYRLTLTITAFLLVLSGVLAAQIKVYSTQEDYCRDNPKAPTCPNGKPIKMYDWTKANPDLAYCQQHPDSPNCKYSIFSQQKGSTSTQKQSTTTVPPSSVTTITTSTPRRPAVSDPNLPASWRFAQPNPDLLMGVNTAALRQSSTLRALLTQIAPALQVKPADLESHLDETKDIDQVWLSGAGNDSIILLQGRTNFPSGWTTMDKGTMAYRISKTAVLVGKEPSVLAAAQRLSKPAGAESAAVRQMRQMGVDNDLWLVGTQSFLKQPQIAAVSEGLSSYALGLSLRNGLKLGVHLKYANVDKARQVMTTLRDNPPIPESVAKLTREMEGSTVIATFAIPQAQLSGAVDRALAAPWGKQLSAMASKSMANADQTVIYGLPGGPRQVETTKPQTPPPGKLMIYGLPGGPKQM